MAHPKRGSKGPAERRAFSLLEIKAVDEAGTFEGYANTYERDAYGDEVQPGAFKRTIDHWRAKGERLPMLSQHDPTVIVGYFDPLDLYEDAKGLHVKGHLLLDTQAGRDHYALAKAGLLKMSIGFDTLRDEVDSKTKTRKLWELRLWEISLVTFPANQSSTITGIKARTFGQVMDDATKADDLHKRYWRMSDGIWTAFFEAMTDEGLSEGERVTAADASLTEFHQAMLGWFRDAMAAEFFTKSGAGPDELKAGRVLSAKTKGTIQAAHDAAAKAVDELSALLKMDEPAEADPSDDGDDDAETGKKKSAPTPGPDADVARLASEIKAAADETKALNAIRDLQRSMSAK